MKIVIGLGAVVLLLIGLVLALPFLIDLNKYQDHYRPLIEDALNRKISLQDIRLTIWPRIGARVGGFTIQDDPAFRSGPFASLSSLDVGVRLIPLLSGKVEVEEITLRNPVIFVLKDKRSLLNVSTVGPRTTAPPQAPTPDTPPTQPAGNPLAALALLAVDRVSIDGGKLTYRDESTPQPTEHEISDLKFLLKSVHLGETPSLHLAATIQPLNLPIKLDGSFGPLAETLDLKQFAFDLGVGKIPIAINGSLISGNLNAMLSSPLINATDLPVTLPLTKPVQVKGFHLTAKAKVPLSQTATGLELIDLPDLGFDVVLGNSILTVKGIVADGRAKMNVTAPTINTADLPVDVGLKKPVEIKDLRLSAELKDQDARVNNLSLRLFDGVIKAVGGMTVGSTAPPFNGKVTLQGMQLGPALDTVGTDQISVSGTAGADIALQGRGFSMPDLTKALEGTGHIAVKDGKIEGVNLMNEAFVLLNVVGISSETIKATAFSTIESDFGITQGLINVQRLLMDSHDFQATGNGTVGFDQRLNLKTNLNLSQALSQKIVGSSPAVRLTLSGGRLSLPLLITGTVQAPSYGLDGKVLAGKVQEQVKEKLQGAVQDLLKGSAKPEDLKQQGKDLLKGLLGN